MTTTEQTTRHELAELLELDPSALTDDARLTDDLGLDSLAMMTLSGWLVARGVSARPRTVGDVLQALDGIRLSVVVTDGERGAASTAGLLPPRPRSPLTPVLGNAVYRLTPIQQADLDFLYLLAAGAETGYRWRYRGNPPSQQQFAADLFGQELVQFVARGTASGEPAGHVVAYDHDIAQGHASVGAVFAPGHAGTGQAAEITAVFIRYLFHTFRLHKVYLEVPGFNWPQVESGAGTLFEVEGVLKEHDFYAGRYWDKYVCAVYQLPR
ncbi:GNAT family N-acetyltransferase [Actinophytocola oryzae]|uniref:RimJ/RimL family protein N-acetyltransferase n=1 Tax=Actinophytocola oryzae TaxID=502181 RepID=A0A4R7VSX6_9PSEU|nr:GNAT family N-acetyltransferase [Actinophytocola oryzae]TDV52317.1 RimJ/RimL family protein N-acetyltransferase [Actinophytocola oryzae]